MGSFPFATPDYTKSVFVTRRIFKLLFLLGGRVETRREIYY